MENSRDLLRFDHYLNYAEMCAALRRFADQFPNLVRLEVIGKSHEAREILIAIVTNWGSGDASEKPALWLDGNIHATELTASMVCMYHLQHLVTRYGIDEDVTRCLDTRAFYICPRVNPDGAEWALAVPPRMVRSGTRPYPIVDEPGHGLSESDIDGDGRVLVMRIPDSAGGWKRHPDDPRLMIRRGPTDDGDEYFRLAREGRIEGYDGDQFKQIQPGERVDFNRNFPQNWQGEHAQPGAGPFPTSEPEVRAVVEFITSHLNIVIAISGHTPSGVILRPFTDKSDEQMPRTDKSFYKLLGELGTRQTGYPVVNVFQEFRYPDVKYSGGFDWVYEHQGVFCWSPEYWAPHREAGITDIEHYLHWWFDHPPEHDLAMLRWSDAKCGGRGYVDWYPFDHPELGKIELGGWDRLYTLLNPPGELLEREVSKFPSWFVANLLSTPRLALREATATLVAAGVWRISIVVENTGYLPSYGSEMALLKKIVPGAIAQIELAEGMALVEGQAECALGQLAGRNRQEAGWLFLDGSTSNRAKCSWYVRASIGATVRLTVRHDRAGTVRTEVVLS